MLLSKFPQKKDDEDEPIGVSPCGRFFKYDIEVGRGSFKTVFRGLDTQTGVAVAWCELLDKKVNKVERLRFREEVKSRGFEPRTIEKIFIWFFFVVVVNLTGGHVEEAAAPEYRAVLQLLGAQHCEAQKYCPGDRTDAQRHFEELFAALQENQSEGVEVVVSTDSERTLVFAFTIAADYPSRFEV